MAIAFTSIAVTSSSTCTKYEVVWDEKAGSSVPGEMLKDFKRHFSSSSSSVVASVVSSVVDSVVVIGVSVVEGASVELGDETVTFTPACDMERGAASMLHASSP